MNELKNVITASELRTIIYNRIPKANSCDNYLSQLEEFENFDSFADRIFQVNDITSTIQSAINNYALICINDLKQSKKYVNLDQETQKKIDGYQYEIKKRDEILKIIPVSRKNKSLICIGNYRNVDRKNF